MNAWVLLIHETPDGAWHYDWMMQSAAVDPNAPLITFRTRHRPDDPACMSFPAERLADHRAAYLAYEGPVSGDRGRVRRLAQGTCQIIHDAGEFVVEGDGFGRWTGRRAGTESPLYQFVRD